MSMFRRRLLMANALTYNTPSPDCYYDFSLGSNEDENKETVVDQVMKLNTLLEK